MCASSPPVIEFDHVSKFFGSFCALKDVHFSVQKSEVCGLLGPNGAGKTTLIGLLSGLMKVSSGAIRVNGQNVTVSSVSVRRLLGVVPQELVYDPFLRVREALYIQAGLHGIRVDPNWVDELLTELGLLDVFHRKMNQLSGGMKRRLMVALALVHRPPVVVLDEPTAGVDVERRMALWSFFRRLNREGHTILLTSHYLKEVEFLCDRVVFIQKGHLVAAGPLPSLLKHSGGIVISFVLPPDTDLPVHWHPWVSVRQGQFYTLILNDHAQLLSCFSDLVPLNMRQLTVQEPTLEDLYLRFTQGKGQDL